MVKRYYTTAHYDARKSIGHLIRRASNLVTAAVEDIFAEKDMTLVQYVVLIYLRDGMASTAAEICQLLRYDSGALTRILDQLEHRGLLVRKRNGKDRRVVTLALTPPGRKTVESLIPLLVDLYNPLLADFTRQEADTLIRLLTRFITNLSEREKS